MDELDSFLRHLDALERQNGEMSRAAGNQRDAMLVTAEIQRRQAEVQRRQAEWLERLQASDELMQSDLERHRERMNHIDLRVSEVTDKLNGLIVFMDDFFRRRADDQ